MWGDATRFQGAEDVVFTAMEDEAVLLNLTTKQYYGLNESAMLIWQLVQIGSSVSEMAGAIAEDYEVSPGDARDAVASLIEELLEEGLLQELHEGEDDLLAVRHHRPPSPDLPAMGHSMPYAPHGHENSL